MSTTCTKPFFASSRLGLLLFVVMLIGAQAGAAQVVETDPAFPTTGQPVTVYFNADEGTGGLAGHDGDVYAHTGVITADSDPKRGCSGVDWRHVKTGWGENKPDTKLEHVSKNRYKLQIDGIRSYYGASGSEEILKLAFVFRSGELVGGTYREGKAEGGCDIFIKLSQSGAVEARITEPAVGPLSPLLVERDTTVRVTAIASAQGAALAELSLLANGEQVAAISDDTLRYDLALDAPGRINLVAVAESQDGRTDTARTYAVRIGPGETAPLPEGARPGINYAEGDPSQATLVLYAPGKEHVFTLGDFSGWEVDPAYRLKKAQPAPDSTLWWITLGGLQAGRQYGFQYFVDGEIRVADPFAHQLLTTNDQYIDENTYPNLKPYPENMTRGPVAVIETGQAEYDWQDDDYERPPQKNLIIYELLLRDFVENHDYETLTDTLAYLDRLGVTAIELMPVAEYSGNESWGYNPTFALAPDKYYGPAADLKRFVDAAHQRGIAVVMDVVFNHAEDLSPLVQLFGVRDDNPWINIPARHPFSVFRDLDHENAFVRYWLDRANAYWMRKFHIDGYRFDLSKGFTQTDTRGDVAAWGQYDASRVHNLKRMADHIWADDDSAYVILEHFSEDREQIELANYGTGKDHHGMMLWHNMNRQYSQSAMGYLNDGARSSSLRETYPPFMDGGYPVTGLVTYMESHDEQWLMYRNLAYGASEGGYDVAELPTALQRQELVGAFFFTVPGPRMMWQFGELGYGYGESGEQCLRDADGECPPAAPGRVSEKPIRWDYRSDPNRAELYNAWAALLHLRRQHDVFTDPTTNVSMKVGQGEPSRRIRLSLGDMQVVVIGNFGTSARAVNPLFHETGTWYDYFSGESVEVSDTEAPITLEPGAYRVFTSQPVDFPENSQITLTDREPPSGAPEDVRLAPVYPNPTHRSVRLRYGLRRAGDVRLALYDALGREVAVLAEGRRAAGAHRLRFDASRLTAGTYFLRLQAGGQFHTRSLTVVR